MQDNEFITFSKLVTADIEEYIIRTISENKIILQNMSVKQNTWQELIPAIEIIENKINVIIATISHLIEVTNNNKWVELFEKVKKHILQYRLDVLQNHSIYTQLRYIEKNEYLNSHQKHYLEQYFQSAKQAGILLVDSQRNELFEVHSEIVELCNKYNSNIDKSMNLTVIQVKNLEELDGITENILNRIKKEAILEYKNGWLIPCEHSLYQDLMSYSINMKLRKSLYFKYSSIASQKHTKEYDNEPIMLDLLRLRHKLANIFDYNNYAEYVLAYQTIKTPSSVIFFLENIISSNIKNAKSEFTELTEISKRLNYHHIHPWDIRYLSHKLLAEKLNSNFDIKQIQFSLKNTLYTLFDFVKEIFEIQVEEIYDCDAWHNDVRLFSISDQSNQILGYFYLDLFARPGKKFGAWCAELSSRFRNHYKSQLPLCCIVTNFNNNKYLKHENIVTLFHEFGHCLQKILSKIDYSSIAGDNGIPLDQTEIISQFMEHWSFNHLVLQNILAESHGEKWITPLVENINTIKYFQNGLNRIKDAIYGILDINLHSNQISEKGMIQKIYVDLNEKYAISPWSEYDYFPNRFYHIFTGGFAAGYYSYLYSEIIAEKLYFDYIQNKDSSKKILQNFIHIGYLQYIDPLKSVKVKCNTNRLSQ